MISEGKVEEIDDILQIPSDGDLPGEIAYAMSDSYIQNSEKMTDAERLHKLYLDAFRSFTVSVSAKGISYNA